MAKYLIQRIREMRESLGTAVNDVELTALIVAGGDISEAGFRFLTFCNNYALFDVPRQDIAKWYRENGWLSEDKEKALLLIAQRLGLEITEPPDYATSGFSITHHHFELQSGMCKVITVHPEFMKVFISDRPTIPEVDLFSQLASLYK